MLHRPTPQHAGLGIMGLATLIVLGCILLPMAAWGGANAPAGAFAPADAQTSEKLLKDIQTTADRMVTAFNGKKIDALLSHYTADAITMAPGEPALVGTEAQQRSLAEDLGHGLQIRSLKLPQHRVVLCGDLIYMGGPYSYVFAGPDGSGTNTDARCGVMIAQRQKDGTLKLKLEAYNRMAGAPASEPITPEIVRCTTDSPTLPANARLYDQIRDLEKRFERLFIDNQRAQAAGYYADDAALMTGGQVYQGAELKRIVSQDPGHHAMQDIEMKFARVEGNEQMVYVVKWCGWKLKNPVSGMDYTIPGKSLHLWQRQADGSWKILLDLNNFDVTF